jgi:FdhD protein
MMSSVEESVFDGASKREVYKLNSGVYQTKDDFVAKETPVALIFNGISHAVMMATPLNLEDFALGFSLTEGLLDSSHELYGIDVNHISDGIEIHLEVSAACEWRLKDRRRTLAGRTGCGLCGSDSLQQIRRILKPVNSISVDAELIIQVEKNLLSWQKLQGMTGATHAAAWVDLTGKIFRVREDVGRHNALDKLIGDLVKNEISPQSGFFFITSRASFEMIQKAVVFGSGLLAAVSAPTTFAIEVAQANNLALVGYVRGGGLVAYTFPQRFNLAVGQLEK